VSTQFRPLEIPPGVVTKPTKQMTSSNWSEVNLMRWVEGQLSPVGGQSQYPYQFASRCRAIHSWYGLDATLHTAYLCESNLYVDTGGVLTEITPANGMNGPTTTPLPPSASGYGAGNYGAGTYDVSGSTAPPPSILPATSYGAGVYGAGAYSTGGTVASEVPIANLPAAYSLDNFGAILLAMTSADQRLLQWDPAAVAGTLATQAANAPLGRCFVVTPERFVMIFATNNDGTADGGSFRRFAWCDQENFTSWNFSDVTSQAGFLDVEPASPIVTAKVTPQGVLFWTATTCYLSTFLGIPYVYNYSEIAKSCTPWSPASIASTASMTLWMSQQGLFSFNGSWVQPQPCAVRPWIDDDIDPLNVRGQACAVHVANFNEYWWFFPQKGQPFNTRCVIYNYRENWWSMGQMSRSAGVTASYTAQTIMADGAVAYEHELGSAYPGATPLPWAESFDLNLSSGSRLTTVKQMIPDIGGDVTNLLYSLFYRISRSVQNGAKVIELQTPPKPVRPDGYVDFRTTGRDIRLRIDLAGPSVNPVTVGQHLVDAVVRGDR
jgi:hypothetical protein